METPPSSPPPESSSTKKSRFPRFKKPAFHFPSRKHNIPDDASSDDANPQQPVAIDPEKAARRYARRAERISQEEEWAQKNHELQREAVTTSRPFVPLDPLPAFHSDSDHEEEEPKAVTSSIEVEGEGMSMHHAPQTAQAPSTEHGGDFFAPVEGDAGRGMAGPYLPSQPDHMKTGMDASAHGHGAHPATPSGAHVAGGMMPPVPPMQPLTQRPPQRNVAADAKLAESFGMQAYSGIAAGHVGEYGQQQQGNAAVPMGSVQMQPHMDMPRRPTHVGWGDTYGSVPSVPLYGSPVMSASHVPLEIDYMLAEKIRRGRELGRLAVAQEEQGNLGAAEAGYLKALELLVPAVKELDMGSELNKNARMVKKKKLQREAAAMLDRVEELKVFLKANGPAVPEDLPPVPMVLPSPPTGGTRGRKEDGENVRKGVEKELEEQRNRMDNLSVSSSSTVSSLVRPAAKKPPTDRAPVKPPPPLPAFFDNDSGDLLERISNRKNVVSSASAGYHSVGNATNLGVAGMTANPSSKQPRATGASCFMCNAPAQFAAPCDHTFCENCGNQAANVFGKCPVPACGEPLSKETFAQLQ